jgi:hypothetical protein
MTEVPAVDQPHYPMLEAFYQWQEMLAELFETGERPDKVTGPFGEHGIHYGNDEHDGGGDYATVGFNLVNNDETKVYAEIEDGTYGEMQGFRIYF